MLVVFKIIKKCSSCKNNYKLIDFRKDNKIFKQCIKCRNINKKSKDKCRCIHNKRKSQCKDCNGSSFCIHHKHKHTCKDCGGSSICQHNKIKSTCKECGGSGICHHNKRKHTCKICNDPIDITIKTMIISSKQKDRLLNIFDETNFVDYLFLKNLIDNSNDKCYYCSCELQYKFYNHTLGTIERLDNTLGHIKSNVVIACKNCNCTRVGSRINPQL
tara:strand:+ start:189 stop:836 length:648 start_codon:yes stop_codon:yes gene_type:complete